MTYYFHEYRNPLYLSLAIVDIPNIIILIKVNIQPIGPMIHRRKIARFHDPVGFREVFLCEALYSVVLVTHGQAI
jgi:hypothetical protein